MKSEEWYGLRQDLVSTLRQEGNVSAIGGRWIALLRSAMCWKPSLAINIEPLTGLFLFEISLNERWETRPQFSLRAVARNRSFRLANSFIRVKASSLVTVARRGRSTLIAFEVFRFFMDSFCTRRRNCQR